MCLTFGSWRSRLLEINQLAWRKRKHTFIEIRSIKNPEYIHKSDKMNSQPLSDSEVSTVTTLWEISFHQPRVFLSFRERKMSFWFFFILKTRVIFLGLCKKRSPRNNHVMDFQFISIRRHIYEGFPSWIELGENFRLKPRKNLQHKYDNSVTLWLWLCWKPPRLQLKSKPWYDLPEKWTLIKRQPKISLGIFQLFLCLRAKEYL